MMDLMDDWSKVNTTSLGKSYWKLYFFLFKLFLEFEKNKKDAVIE